MVVARFYVIAVSAPTIATLRMMLGLTSIVRSLPDLGAYPGPVGWEPLPSIGCVPAHAVTTDP